MADRLTIEMREGLGIASVMARRGTSAAAIGAILGTEMPVGPAAAPAGDRTILGTGPGSWLVVQENASSDFAEDITLQLRDLASVSDQSGSYIVRRLSGPGATRLLQRGAAIDFHPDSFRTGSVATTVIAHIGVILWQVSERPSYDVATFRSLSGSFDRWLAEARAAL